MLHILHGLYTVCGTASDDWHDHLGALSWQAVMEVVTSSMWPRGIPWGYTVCQSLVHLSTLLTCMASSTIRAVTSQQQHWEGPTVGRSWCITPRYIHRRQRLWLAYIHGSQIALIRHRFEVSHLMCFTEWLPLSYNVYQTLFPLLSWCAVRICMCDGQACLLCVCAVKTLKYSVVAMGTTCYEWKRKMVKPIVNWAWFAFILAFLPQQPCITVRSHVHLWLKCMLAFLAVDVQATANSSDLLATSVSVCVCVILCNWKLCSEYLAPDYAKWITVLYTHSYIRIRHDTHHFLNYMLCFPHPHHVLYAHRPMRRCWWTSAVEMCGPSLQGQWWQGCQNTWKQIRWWSCDMYSNKCNWREWLQ